MCDFILAADTAKFGQPEVKLAVSPGMGGSQRLARAVGKAKAMEMCLTGRMMDAAEAERAGLVSRVIPAADLVEEAMKTAATITAMAPLAVLANKEMVNAASSAGSSTACSGRRTRRKAWQRSSPSGRGSGRAGDNGEASDNARLQMFDRAAMIP
jgi:enoyl-CoA hydratase/carnithine racemase